MKTMTVDEFHAAIKNQGASTILGVRLICPMCNRVQTPKDLIDAGAGKTFDDVEKYFGFSCVGRWLNAGPFKKDNLKGCDWTLGGFFKLHKLEVVTTDGKRHPRFELDEKRGAS